MADASVAVLMGLGFPAALAKRALQLEGGDVQRAADMLLTSPPPLDSEPMTIDDDADVCLTKFRPAASSRESQRSHPCSNGGAANLPPDDSSTRSLSQLTGMGFNAQSAARALRQSSGNLEAAMECLVSAPLQQGRQQDQPNWEESKKRRVRHAASSSRAIPDVDHPLRAATSHRGASAVQEVVDSGAAAGITSLRQSACSSDNSSGKIVSEAGRGPASPARARVEPASSSAGASLRVNPQAMQAQKMYTVEHLSSGLRFGPAAFGQLRRTGAGLQGQSSNYMPASSVKKAMEASVPGVKKMTGERGLKHVTQMLTDCYNQGLFMHGPPTSAINSQVIPSIRHIFTELTKLPPKSGKRVSCLTALANACQDCQQVQAREILRIFGDLTSQSETFEVQLRYSLVRQKEAALDRYITRCHASCDQDHTQVQPHQQRAHLISGYVALIGEQFGFDFITAARSDRFLTSVQQEIGRVDVHALVADLRRDLCPKEWLQALLADINNQMSGSERLINRDCIFKWVQSNMSNEAAHSVFYDEDRSDEFEDLDPKAPNQENQYQPFLSPKVLVDMLLTARMLERKKAAGRKH